MDKGTKCDDKDLKKKWHEWKQYVKNNPGVDEKNNVPYCQYKDIKRQFRAELRRAERRYDKEQMTELAELQHIDHAEFWKLVNRARKSPLKVLVHILLLTQKKYVKHGDHTFKNSTLHMKVQGMMIHFMKK